MQKGCRILAVDDDKLVTSSLKALLALEGFDDAVFFNKPETALDYLKNNYRNVIISDFMMEGMNGIEFLSAAAKLYPDSSRILLTGYADKENAVKGINEAGLYKYIEKPWDNDAFIINIKNAYERTLLIEQLKEKNKELIKYSKHLKELVNKKTADIASANERLSAVINSCADAVITVSETGALLEVNPAAEYLFGMSADMLKKKKISEIFETENASLENVLTAGEKTILREIYALNAASGSKLPVEISAAPLHQKNNISERQYVFVVRNIHYQKEMERLREDFIAALTHDLRTPSAASIQTLEYFLNGALGALNDKQKMLLKTMKKSHEDMLGLVNTLLEVYKYEAGRLKLVKTQFDPKRLINECIEQVMPIAESKHQHIERIFINLDSGKIYADRNELRRVIVNLLGNAVKYTNESGLIEVHAQIDGDCFRFSVKDNGEGIYKQDIPLLFKRFSQGTHEKRSIGTGLGLYLSKQIIDAHGGKIWLESDKGKGSEFFFILPDAVSADNKEKDKVWAI